MGNGTQDALDTTPLAPKGATQTFSLREMLAIAYRDRRRIMLGFAIPFVIILLTALMMRPNYISDASLLVRLGHEYVYVADTTIGSTNNGTPLSFDPADALNAETEILSSRDLIKQTITKVGLARLYPSIDRRRDSPSQPKIDLAVEQFRGNLDAQLLKDSTVITVSFKHPDQALAQQALQALIDTYLDRRRAIFSDPHVDFMSHQVSEVEQRLQLSDKQLTAFKQSHSIVNYDQQITLLLQQSNALKSQIDDSNQQMAISNARAQILKHVTQKTPNRQVEYTETLADAQAPRQLLDLRLKEQSLRSRYFDNNPLVIRAHQDVTTAEAFLQQQQRDPLKTERVGRNPVRDAAELDLLKANTDEIAYTRSRTVLQAQLDQVKAQAARLAQQQSELNMLTLQQKLLEDSYANDVQKLEAARMDEARDQKEQTNVSVLQAANFPLQRKSARLLLIIVGTFVSLGIALLVALLSEALRSSFLTPEQLERSTGVPVLATVPMMGS